VTVTTISCESLRSRCLGAWEAFPEHPFLRELVAATLPLEKFRFYIEQNLLYLPEYARAMAVGAAKARDLDDVAYFLGAVTNVLESEIPENRELHERVLALGAPDRGGSVAMAPANLAYTSFLLATAFRSGPTEIMAAITPCTWSYGDIASSLDDVAEHPVYAEWIRFFGTPAYGAIVDEMRARLDRLAASAGEAGLAHLSELFTTSARLELAFWDMAYELRQWPDLAGAS
jgi:thiaminase/transcriptional activator TenA